MRRRLFILLFLFSVSLPCLAQVEREPDLKAAFIYNFTRYIDWDSSAIKDNFIIGVLGSSPLIAPLNQIARTNTVKDRKIIVRRFNRPEDIRECHVLFIPHDASFSLSSILDRVSKGTLTIGEEPGFAERGTALNFIVKNDKLKFEANLKAIYSAGLSAGSQLLKLAVIVD